MNFIVYSNLWIAAGAALITAQTQWALIGRTDLSMPAFVFFATLATYNFHRLVRFNKWALRLQSRRLTFLMKWRKILTVITSVSLCVAAMLALVTFNSGQWIVLILTTVIAAFYALPFQLNAMKLAPLREWPGLKVFLIGFSWAGVTALLPLMSENSLSYAVCSMAVVERFFFIVALSIPFDTRDLGFDLPGQKTIPQLLGQQGAGVAAIASAVIFLSIAFLNPIYSNNTIAALIVSGAGAVGALCFSLSKRSDSYYEWLLDGLIILQALLVMIFSLL